MPKTDPTHWTIIGEPTKRPTARGFEWWVLCRCQCGREKEVRKNAVVYRQSTSCGECGIQRNGKPIGFKHGMTGTPEYACYHAMLQRCSNPKAEAYRHYGARGITVCARWRGSFEAFFADMGLRPAPDLSIDRVDNDKGYWCGKAECPECGPAGRTPNCEWGDDEQQGDHRTNTHKVELDGRSQTVEAWAKEFGIKPNVVRERLRMGWGLERALTQEVAPYRWKSKESTAGRRVLSDQDIRDILRDYVKGSKTHGAPAQAAKYGVTRQTVEKIIRSNQTADPPA